MLCCNFIQGKWQTKIKIFQIQGNSNQYITKITLLKYLLHESHLVPRMRCQRKKMCFSLKLSTIVFCNILFFKHQSFLKIPQNKVLVKYYKQCDTPIYDNNLTGLLLNNCVELTTWGFFLKRLRLNGAEKGVL